MRNLNIFTFFLFLASANGFAQTSTLKAQIQEVIKGKRATVGISIIANSFKDTININADVHLPMQSVYKFPISLALLKEIEKGKFLLQQKIVVTKKDLLSDTWSPIREKYPTGREMSIAEIMEYAVSQSDNNGCDILLRLIGGTAQVENFLKQNQLNNISVKTTEEQAQKDWSLQFKNWSTAAALTHLLTRSYENKDNKLLSNANYKFIWKVMEQTTTGSKRIKGQLPVNTVVGHKTGTSGIKAGITAATNDIGVIKLPDGGLIFISVLVSGSLESEQINEKIISDISRLAYEHYTNKGLKE